MTKKDTRTMLHSESTSSLQNLDFIEDWDLSDVVDLNASFPENMLGMFDRTPPQRSHWEGLLTHTLSEKDVGPAIFEHYQKYSMTPEALGTDRNESVRLLNNSWLVDSEMLKRYTAELDADPNHPMHSVEKIEVDSDASTIDMSQRDISSELGKHATINPGLRSLSKTASMWDASRLGMLPSLTNPDGPTGLRKIIQAFKEFRSSKDSLWSLTIDGKMQSLVQSSPGEWEVKAPIEPLLTNITKWDTSGMLNMGEMFSSYIQMQPTISDWAGLLEQRIGEDEVGSAAFKHYIQHTAAIESLGLNTEDGSKMLHDTWFAERAIRSAIEVQEKENASFSNE